MIHILNKANTKKILIDKHLNVEEDIVNLLLELSNITKGVLCEINFIDVDCIPERIIKQLYLLKDNISITTTHKSLWVYLSKLGIRNKLQGDFERGLQHKPLIAAIAIGGSAGSIDKILKLLRYIPYTDISIFIIVHILPDKKSHLSDIFQKETPYDVYEASHNTKIEKSSVYIASPNRHLTVVDGYIYLDNTDPVNYAKPSIDISFKSLAYEYQNSLMAILLCGYGNDGSSSLEDLKQNGSEILIQEPHECEAQDMLISAIQTNHFTKVLTLEKMQRYIKSTVSVEVDIEDEIEVFLENIETVYGYDFRQYDRNSLMRRIKLVMSQSLISTFKEFKQIVLDDDLLFTKLLSAFSINVTTFLEILKYINK